MARRGKRLSTADKELWGRVARTTNPLPGRMEDLLKPGDVEENPSLGDPKPASQRPLRAREKTAPDDKGMTRALRETLAARFNNGGDAQSPRREAPTTSTPGRHQRTRIERPTHRKLSRGRLGLDARIDLHGLDLASAHDALLAFLSRSRARGDRHVLVITGKGTSFGSEGAIKRAVPLWLSKAEFATLVSGYDAAARGHGGDGALYIRLKKAGGGGAS